jgi:GAF domain-containing protein
MNGNVAAAYGINAKSLKSMTCVPVHDALGNVVAVIQAINKVGTGTVPSGQFLRRRITVDWKEKGFTKDDVQVLQALATRISITFEGMQRENQKLHLRDTIKILREHGTLQLQ